ncbi:MAG TPA: hypothetical protein DCG69_06195 [Bacteroidales bacterium]|nr:hypothetical protein [Bacteroidales bacterium]
MKRLFLLLIIIINALSSFAQKNYVYPIAPKDSIVDVYFDTKISDPYQWMENPDDPRLIAWMESQKALTQKQANKQTRIWTLRGQLASMYNDVDKDITEDYKKTDSKLLSKYVFKYELDRDDRAPSLLYKQRQGSMDRYLVKIKDFRLGKKDHVVIASYDVNEDEDIAVVRMSVNGSDWQTAYLFELKTGTQLSDTIKYLRSNSAIVWHGRNIYYDRYEMPEKGRELLDKAIGQKLYYHVIGTSQEKDQMLFQNPDNTGTNSIHFFKMRKKLFFYHYQTINKQMIKVLSESDINPEKFLLKSFLYYPNVDSINMEIAAKRGDSILLMTNWGAPNGRVLLVDINRPNQASEFIPEYDINLEDVDKLGMDKITCIYRKNDQNIALIFDLSGALLKKIEFPKGKKLNGFYENSDLVNHTNFNITSFYHPPLWYQLSLKDLTFKPIQAVSVPYDPESLETRYVEYESKDGTMIPMYLTCLKETKLNGKNPVLLYGYGGYGITVDPNFDQSTALLLLYGGILAVPNIRGGGGLGNEWALQGRNLKKQNAIDDFIGAAEYLIKENYTNPDKLVINGASHGGLLVASAMTQRPELFKAVIAEAGPYDMLRFEKFTIGAVSTNLNEFGSVENEDEFINRKSYSPLQNLKAGVSYPNLLLITGENDDRVPPLHSYKFLAALQELGDAKSIYQIYITPGSGHGGALTQNDWTDALLFKYYFLFDQLNIDFY